MDNPRWLTINDVWEAFQALCGDEPPSWTEDEFRLRARERRDYLFASDAGPTDEPDWEWLGGLVETMWRETDHRTHKLLPGVYLLKESGSMPVADIEIEAEAQCERLGLTTAVRRVALLIDGDVGVVLEDHQHVGMGGLPRLTPPVSQIILVAEGEVGINAWNVTGAYQHGCGIADMLAALDPAGNWDVLEDWTVPRVDEAALIRKHFCDDSDTPMSLDPDEDGRVVAVVVRQSLANDEDTPVVELYPERCSDEGAQYLGLPRRASS